jgi:hypothetical protein
MQTSGCGHKTCRHDVKQQCLLTNAGRTCLLEDATMQNRWQDVGELTDTERDDMLYIG